MNTEERAEYIVNSLRDSIPLIAEEIRTAQREAMERAYQAAADGWAKSREAGNGPMDAWSDAMDAIRALIAKLGEQS